jgi:hypothetical protein
MKNVAAAATTIVTAASIIDVVVVVVLFRCISLPSANTMDKRIPLIGKKANKL